MFPEEALVYSRDVWKSFLFPGGCHWTFLEAFFDRFQRYPLHVPLEVLWDVSREFLSVVVCRNPVLRDLSWTFPEVFSGHYHGILFHLIPLD